MDLFRKRDKKLNKAAYNGGFTLVELIAVLAIIGILAGVSAGGLLGYTKNAAFRRNQANAETIFNAAQSALTYYKASGKLSDFEKSLPDNHEVPSEVLTDSAKGRVVSLMLTKESGSKVTALAAGDSASGVSDEEEILIDMLRDYVTEADIFKASICVELNPADGIVYSVLYCDRADALTYGTAGSKEVSIGTAADREETVRREKALGYYTSEMLSSEPEKTESFRISDVELVNGDTLDLIWSMECENRNAWKQMEYTIVLKNKSSNKKKAEIRIYPQNGVLALTEEEKTRSQITADVILYGEEETDTKELSDLKFHAYLNEKDQVVLTLDAVDEGLTAAETDAQIQETYSARRFSLWDGAAHYGLDLDDADPILAIVSASYGGEIEENISNSANMLFGEPVYEAVDDEAEPETVRTEENGEIIYHYGIESMRHLYNARFRELDTHYTEDEIVYEVRKNLAWGGIGESNTLKNSGSGSSKTEVTYGLLSYTTASPKGGAQTLNAGESYTKYFKNGAPIEGSSNGGETASHDPAFAGLSQLGVLGENGHRATLTSVERENYALSDDGKEDDGVADTGKSFTISNLALAAAGSAEDSADADSTSGSSSDNTDSGGEEGSSALGLVARNYGTISNLILKDAEIRGIVTGAAAAVSDNVGAFCGINAGSLTNLKTEGGSVTGGENVGGILGRSIRSSTLSKLENDADVSGKSRVGGILGAVGGTTAEGGEENQVRLEDCKNTGMISGYQASETQEETSDPAQYIGGIAGYVYANGFIESCISSPELSEDASGDVSYDALFEKYGTADYVGGIAGYMADGSGTENIPRILNCRAEGSYVIGRDYVGGIVGWNGKNADITECSVGYASADDGSLHVYGRDYTGGAVGYNASSISRTTGIRGNAAVQGRHFVGGFVGGTTSGLGDCSVNVDYVKGEFFVGGYVGAAFLGNDVTNIAPNAEDFLPCKDVTGTAFVGGILGFAGGIHASDEDREDLAAYAEELQTAWASSDSQTLAAGTALQNILSFCGDASASLTMGGTAGNEVESSQEMQISGDLFVGGLFGYITENIGWTAAESFPSPMERAGKRFAHGMPGECARFWIFAQKNGYPLLLW